MTINHQFWAPRENGGGDRPRNAQWWAIVGRSNPPWPWPWPWIRSRSHQHAQYLSTTSMPNHVTVASRSTEIPVWPFECREISTLCEAWTLVIAFLGGNSKIGLWQAIGRSHIITSTHHFWAACESGGGDRPRTVQSWAIVGSSDAPWPWPWPWMGSRSHQHTQCVGL